MRREVEYHNNRFTTNQSHQRPAYAPTTKNKMLTSLLVLCAVVITFYQETDAQSAPCLGCKTPPCPCRRSLTLGKRLSSEVNTEDICAVARALKCSLTSSL